MRAREGYQEVRGRVRRLTREQHLRLLLLAVIVGVAADLGAVAVRQLIRGVQWLFTGSAQDLLVSVAALPWWRILFMPALGGLLVGPLVWFLARDASGHGVPEVIQALLMRGGRIRARVAVIKGVASALTLGSGGSAGREGPMIHIGASLGSAVARRTRLTEEGVRTLVAAGAAGGLAAAFNAPIAGSLFALEVVLGDFAIASFSPVVMAGVAATVVSRAFFGEVSIFVIPQYALASPLEFFPYAVLGLAAGFVAVGFTLVLYEQERMWERLGVPPWVKPAVGGLAVGALALLFPQILGIGHLAMDRMLEGRVAPAVMLALVLAKILATSMTLGMGAVVAATSHAPLTGILIMLELTGDYRIILPVMTACILATVVASTLKDESIYTQKLKWKGISLLQGREEGILRYLPVTALLQRQYVAFAEDAPLHGVLADALGSVQTTFPIVDGDGALTGVIHIQDLHGALDDREVLGSVLVAGDLVNETPVLRESDTAERALQLLSESGADLLPVVDGSRRLVGVVLAGDVLERYAHELQKLRLAATIAQRRSFTVETDGVESGHGMRLAEEAVPPGLVGLTLSDARLRARFGVEVLYLLKGPYRIRKLAGPDVTFEEGDRMVVMAEAAALQRFRAEVARLEGGRVRASTRT